MQRKRPAAAAHATDDLLEKRGWIGLVRVDEDLDKNRYPLENTMKTRILAAAAATLALAGAASAQSFVFNANLSGLNEVPANDSPALGFLTGVYDTDANTFSFSWLISDNLVGTPASPGAHIHAGAAGTNGPVVFGFAEPDGSWALSGSAVWSNISQANVDALFAGNLYANFHTTTFPGGEVRGQITLVPAPGAVGVLAAGSLVMVRRRRR